MLRTGSDRDGGTQRSVDRTRQSRPAAQLSCLTRSAVYAEALVAPTRTNIWKYNIKNKIIQYIIVHFEGNKIIFR